MLSFLRRMRCLCLFVCLFVCLSVCLAACLFGCLVGWLFVSVCFSLLSQDIFFHQQLSEIWQDAVTYSSVLYST